MRFAIAATVLVQILPVTSEDNDLVAFLEGNLEKEVKKTSIHSLLQTGNDVKPRTWNGIRRKNGRKSGDLWLNQVQHNEALKNAPQDESAIVKCDPKESVDVGVLSCGPREFCMESERSSLGGFCMESAFSLPRSLQGFHSSGLGLEYYYQAFCNESSPYFYSLCDCEDFDGETLNGTIECQLYENKCLVPDCKDTCVSTNMSFTGEGPLEHGYSTCVNVVSTDGEESGCYGYNANSANETYTCYASWNGTDCNCTIVDTLNATNVTCATTMIDCPGDGPSEICGEDFLDQFSAIKACVPSFFPSYNGCQLCSVPGTVLDPNAILTLPGHGYLPCVTVDEAASSGKFTSTDCPLVQEFAGPHCCI